MTYVLKPGPKRLAAAFMFGGWSNVTYQPNVTDGNGKLWVKPSTLLVALAVCGAESSGDALATHVNYPGSAQMSTDWGLMQINDHYNQEFWQSPSQSIPGTPWDWRDPIDNASAAHQIFINAGHKFSPWMAYVGGGWLRVRYEKQSWLDWAQTGITEALAAQKAGAPLAEIASVDDDPLVTQ